MIGRYSVTALTCKLNKDILDMITKSPLSIKGPIELLIQTVQKKVAGKREQTKL